MGGHGRGFLQNKMQNSISVSLRWINGIPFQAADVFDLSTAMTGIRIVVLHSTANDRYYTSRTVWWLPAAINQAHYWRPMASNIVALVILGTAKTGLCIINSAISLNKATAVRSGAYYSQDCHGLHIAAPVWYYILNKPNHLLLVASPSCRFITFPPLFSRTVSFWFSSFMQFHRCFYSLYLLFNYLCPLLLPISHGVLDLCSIAFGLAFFCLLRLGDV